MTRLACLTFGLTALLAPLTACTDEVDPYEGSTVKSDDGKTDTSALAVFLEAKFDGTLLTDSSWDDTSTVQDQLLYTVGQLNGINSVGRIDKAVLTNVVKTQVGGKTQIKYTAVLPIAWPKRNPIPASITLKLPLDISNGGQTAFADKYKHSCVDFGAHDVDAGSMFYYYRPAASGCSIADADLNKVTADLSPSPTQSTGKYPEYDKVWEDGKFEVLAIFGKYEDGATTASDAGIDAYNDFIAAMKQELGARNLVTIPASIPSSPGVATPDVEFSATLPDGKTIHVVGLLTDNVNTGLSQPAFRARYEALSTRADFIVYNGHAGLGTNVRALAQAGKWVKGQYVVIYMNGCDTFAYIDDALNRAHKNLNSDDTTGFKYVDIVNNAMPAFFASMSGATMAMFRGLLQYQDPQTYEQIFRNVDSSQIVLVAGEQDNVFTPGGGGTPTTWVGLRDSGTVKRNEKKSYSTPVLEAGDYQFSITGSSDADLYVRTGSAPTTARFDCRPYLTGSAESCTVKLSQPAAIFVMVNGYAATSNFEIVGKKL
ncbi:MAG: PPC domain-containing protein [Kofleriaceae bacterium]